MQFKDGYWRVRDGVTAHHPQHVERAEPTDDGVRLLAPAKRIRGRADTLGGLVFSVELSAPMEGAIAVEVTHHRGSVRRSATPTKPTLAPFAPDVSIDDDTVMVTSGTLQATIDRDDWRLDFSADGRRLTGSGFKDLAIVERDGPSGPEHHMVEQLAIGVEEHLYGLGERFGPLVKNGQVVDIWNADGGTASELAYKNVPFYLSDQGYGVFVDHPGRVSFEVASQTVGRVQFSVEDHQLRYVIIQGDTPLEVLERYTTLTGKPALPPAWTFGLWLTTSFTTDYDEATVSSFVDGMAERDLPLSVFHFDCFWMRGFQWTDLVWDPATFPDPEAMLARLKAKGLRICVWINPYIAQESALFDEGVEGGFLVTRPDGRVWQWDEWQPGMALVDFTNPAACAWFAERLEPLLDMGVDCFKTDFGERIPTDVVYHDGSDPELFHNVYTHAYNETVFELLTRHRGEGEAVVFARSAAAGGQQFPVHWGGDTESTYEAMAESIRGGLSLGMSGFGYWSHDIGGFEGTPDPELFKRWIAFGLLGSHSRLHGSMSYRVPWLVDDESVDVLRHFTRRKMELMPHLWGLAVETHERGVPMMRAMVLEFPDDPACAYLDRQYLLGADLLVAPLFRPDQTVQYYVPAGRWTRLFGDEGGEGEVIEGPGWRTEQHSVFSLPVLVRPGTVLVTGPDGRPDRDLTDDLTVTVYELDDGATASARVPGPDGSGGVVFTASRSGGTVTVTRDGGDRPWRARVGTEDVVEIAATDDRIELVVVDLEG